MDQFACSLRPPAPPAPARPQQPHIPAPAPPRPACPAAHTGVPAPALAPAPPAPPTSADPPLALRLGGHDVPACFGHCSCATPARCLPDTAHTGCLSAGPARCGRADLEVRRLFTAPTSLPLAFCGTTFFLLPDHHLNSRFADRPTMVASGSVDWAVRSPRGQLRPLWVSPRHEPTAPPTPPTHPACPCHVFTVFYLAAGTTSPSSHVSLPCLGHGSSPAPHHLASAPRLELAELVGNLQFVAPALHAGSTFLRAFYDALHALDLAPADRPGTNYATQVPLPNGFWADFDHYKRILAAHTGRRVLRGDWLTIARAWTDASKAGTGVSVLHNDEQGRPLTQLQFLAGVWPKHLALNSSNWRELRTILYALQQSKDMQDVSGQRRLDGTVLYVFTDNAVSAAAVNRGTSTSPSLLRLVKGLREYETLLGCHVVAVWVPGTAIIAQGTDGLSRGALDEGALADDLPDPLAFSPVDVGCPTAEPVFLRAVADTFPLSACILTDADSWFQQPHPHRTTVLAPPPSLARQAIDQALRWRAAHPYTTGVAVVLPNNYAAGWGRLAKNFTRVYFARGGTFSRPDDGAGTFVVMYLLPHLDSTHGYAEFAAAPPNGDRAPDLSRYQRHLDPAVRCTPADAHHPLASLLSDIGADPPPQLPQRLLHTALPDTVHCRGLLLAPRPSPPPPLLVQPAVTAGRFPPAPAANLERLACLYCHRRDVHSALAVLSQVDVGSVPDRAAWRRAAVHSYGIAVDGLYATSPDAAVHVLFYRLPYYLWSDFAYGIVPAFGSLPELVRRDNYSTSDHAAVFTEIDRLIARGYVAASDDDPRDCLIIPLGAVPKKDSDKPRMIVDATACGLNEATDFLRFKYPAFEDFVSLAYPGSWYWKLDWTDAFFACPFYAPFRRFFSFVHPRGGGLYHYTVLPFGWKLSPFYYSRLVHAYVDVLRLGRYFRGPLQQNHHHHPVHHQRLPLLFRLGDDGLPATALDQYCDDGIGFSATRAAGHAALSAALRLVGHFGAVAKSSKTVPPTQSGEHVLGLELHTGGDGMSVVIPPDRLRDLQLRLRDFDSKYRPQC